MAYLQFKNISKTYPNGFKALHNIDLSIEKGDFLVLVGPSGCAKSTLLRMIAGLEDITDGDIIIDGKVVNEMLPKDRDIAMVFQDYALYPHFSIYDNVAFGLKMKKTPKNIIDAEVQKVAVNLEIDHLLDKKPRQLSGGQRQRVALARALVKQPKIFLLDEPLSNLDAKLRVHTRAKISELHRELDATMVYVTHDQVEAMTMGNKVCVLNAGRIMQVGSPLDLYDYPANKFVASFLGSPAMNIIEGVLEPSADSTEVHFTFGSIALPIPPSKHALLAAHLDAPAYFGIRPSQILLHNDVAGNDDNNDDSGNNLNVDRSTLVSVKGFVSLVEKTGSQAFLHFSVEGQSMVAKVRTKSIASIEIGSSIDLYFVMESCHIFDGETEENLTLPADAGANANAGAYAGAGADAGANAGAGANANAGANAGASADANAGADAGSRGAE